MGGYQTALSLIFSCCPRQWITILSLSSFISSWNGIELYTSKRALGNCVLSIRCNINRLRDDYQWNSQLYTNGLFNHYESSQNTAHRQYLWTRLDNSSLGMNSNSKNADRQKKIDQFKILNTDFTVITRTFLFSFNSIEIIFVFIWYGEKQRAHIRTYCIVFIVWLPLPPVNIHYRYSWSAINKKIHWNNWNKLKWHKKTRKI